MSSLALVDSFKSSNANDVENRIKKSNDLSTFDTTNQKTFDEGSFPKQRRTGDDVMTGMMARTLRARAPMARLMRSLPTIRMMKKRDNKDVEEDVMEMRHAFLDRMTRNQPQTSDGMIRMMRGIGARYEDRSI